MRRPVFVLCVILVLCLELLGCQAATEEIPPVVPWNSPTPTVTATYTPTVIPTSTSILIPLPPVLKQETGGSNKEPTETPTATPVPATSTPKPPPQNPKAQWNLAEDPLIELAVFGNSSAPNKLLLVFGIHGGYEAPAGNLGKQTLEYLRTAYIPENVAVMVIPMMNPDGYARGCCSPEGRPNSNGVDLNRNWDFNWSPEATWRGNAVGGGTRPFSEIETQAVSTLTLNSAPKVVVFYHCCSSVGGGYYQNANAAGAAEAFYGRTGYKRLPDVVGITGNAIDWLGEQNIPGLEVELPGPEWQQRNAEHTDFAVNAKGIDALILYVSQQ